MLSVDLAPFFNNFVNALFSFIVQLISLLQNTIVFNIGGNTPITAFDLLLGTLIIEVVFGLFLFIAPRLHSEGV